MLLLTNECICTNIKQEQSHKIHEQYSEVYRDANINWPIQCITDSKK